MSARLLPPRRVNETDRREAHRNPHQDAADVAIGQCLVGRRGRMFEQCCEATGRNHEEAEQRPLHRVLLPVASGRGHL